MRGQRSALGCGVRSRQLEERDRDLTVLGLAACHGEVVAERSRHVLLEVRSRHVGRRRNRAGSGLEAGDQASAVALVGEPATGRAGRRSRLLTTISPAAARSSSSNTRVAAGPATRSSRCGSAVRKKWQRARVDADRHPQLDRADRALGVPDLLDRPLHVRRGARGALGVALAGEEEQQRVAAELEHVAAVPLRDGDQGVEHGRDPLHELLGSGLAVDGEALGESREPGDVDRDERTRRARGPRVPRAPRSRRGRGEGDRGRAGRAPRGRRSRVQHRCSEQLWGTGGRS